ncbi:MAG TPA: pilus assembly protein PilM [Candidatus Rifleibacterium sp.]|nr:pilus assembly protein PilM [Candidatus Rifleibacterium sp.]HPT48157.1 pilus assembly protein PilM [Candidatus Rifleibacterium sp.]
MNLYTELVAIDIGTSSIKLAAVDPGPARQGYVIRNLARADLPQGLVGGDFTSPFISDLTVFKHILAGLVKSVRNTRQGFVIGLPDRWVKLHLALLELSEVERRSPGFLSWRLEKSLPIPEGMKALVDYQILGPSGANDGHFQVLAAAVKKELIEILSSLTTDLHMEVMAFDTSSLGVFNLFEESFPDKTVDQTVINLHVGHETTVVKAYSRGALMYERVIEVAGEEFAKIISELDSVNLETAMKTKESEKFFPVGRADVSLLIERRQRIERIFGNWLRELNVTFRFFQDKFNVSKLPSIFLTGGSSMFAGLDVFLSEYLETACLYFNPLEEIPLAKKLDEARVQAGPAYAACLGLLAK